MKSSEVAIADIESKIYLIRGEKVMLDHDLAELYGVPTMRLHERVTRNAKRFPSDFMFRFSNQEFAVLKSQLAISSSSWGGRRIPPLAFTEQGVAMLVLTSQAFDGPGVYELPILVEERIVFDRRPCVFGGKRLPLSNS